MEQGGGDRKKAKKYNNFVNPTLLTGEDDLTVLSKVNVPELQCMIGVSSKLMCQIEKCWPSKLEGRAWMDQFLKRVS